MTARRYLVLLAIIFSAAIGDILLSVGMKQIGAISPARWLDLLFAIRNPFVVLGILCLLIFFGSYLTALSWADLTFVLPATALGYVVLALLSRLVGAPSQEFGTVAEASAGEVIVLNFAHQLVPKWNPLGGALG